MVFLDFWLLSNTLCLGYLQYMLLKFRGSHRLLKQKYIECEETEIVFTNMKGCCGCIALNFFPENKCLYWLLEWHMTLKCLSLSLNLKRNYTSTKCISNREFSISWANYLKPCFLVSSSLKCRWQYLPH